jgi:hypothetical protein
MSFPYFKMITFNFLNIGDCAKNEVTSAEVTKNCKSWEWRDP